MKKVRPKVSKELQILSDKLLQVIEGAAEKWEKDPEFDVHDVGSMVMTAMTTISGEVMAMTLHAIGTKKERWQEACEMGAGMIKMGAIQTALALLNMLEDMPDDWESGDHPTVQ